MPSITAVLPLWIALLSFLLIGHDSVLVCGFQHYAAESSRATKRQESSSSSSSRSSSSSSSSTIIRWTQSSSSNDIQEQQQEEKSVVNTSTGSSFGFQTIAPKPIIPFSVEDDSEAEVQARKLDEPMFTASVRRDLYNVMRNPFKPHIGAPAPLSWWGSAEDDDDSSSDGDNTDNDSEQSYEESSQFGGILLGKQEHTTSTKATSQDIYFWDTYAFTDRMTYDPAGSCEGFTVLDDNQVISAIAILGSSSTPHSIALTKAFEAWLAELAASHWGDLEASRLSVEFLIAFGNELTERLGVNHRILSTTLTQEEMNILSEPPFSPYILPELLEDFQTSKIEVDEEQAEATASTLWWDQDENSPEY
eukprot:CAMPEP_0113605256 /NCGR_PEP_ID=MMETSP0017_2-20120614/2230_1 /TAXON_ID=2856 /ORGANISM="Cylindrotheca closterium" /LENGTH=362 /DNA_ID=CAMNT_0000513733 /DNA_START=95 /DNA_END=1183 /DNA_ORIENTATION=- /assembly_acc=CAM_ASM_000147